MKKIYSIVSIIVIVFSALVVQAEKTPTVKEQLDNLNENWKSKNFDDAVLTQRIPRNDDVSLIKMHLSLIEKKLRAENIATLNNEQRENRSACLDILHEYYERGVFPKNLYHKKRTPYFIDNFGTACAVGQLIISTGYNDFAKRVSKENNYASINELTKIYPEIKQWAVKEGFTVDELAWIQPFYGICDTICRQAGDVYPNGGTSPYTYLWSNGETTKRAIHLCPLTVYTCLVIDALSDTIRGDTLYGGWSWGIDSLIIAATPLYCSLTSTPADGGCNGTATATVTMGGGKYGYYWFVDGQTTQTAVGLCPATYWVDVFDSTSGCDRFDSVVVSSVTAVNENSQPGFTIYPNPANETLTIQTPAGAGNNNTVTIYNLVGEIITKQKLTGIKSKLDIHQLTDGIYFISINGGTSSTRQKIIKL